jgi:hypothetical protein
MLVIYHAWENYQFQGGVGYQSLIASPLNPVELSGGHFHLRPMTPCMQPSHTDRDTRVEVEVIKASKDRPRSEQTATLRRWTPNSARSDASTDTPESSQPRSSPRVVPGLHPNSPEE